MASASAYRRIQDVGVGATGAWGNCPELLGSNWALNPILPSITQMIELLSADEEVKTEVTAKIEAGEDVTIKESRCYGRMG